MTEKKSLSLTGARPTSNQLKQGLPIFLKQLIAILKLEASSPRKKLEVDQVGVANAASENDEVALANANGRHGEAEVAKVAGLYGQELRRLGYTLLHVVHAYGAICQSITELATMKSILIDSKEFRELNMCLDVAIAGAVIEYQNLSNTQTKTQEIESFGFLAHELRNSLNSVNISLELIKSGKVGFAGSTGQVLEDSLKRIDQLIGRSLTQVRLRVDPLLQIAASSLLQVVEQILVTAQAEANTKMQILDIQIDPTLIVEVDQQLFYSALSNLIQNAIKYSHFGSRIQIRGFSVENNIFIEVEDECGGLTNTAIDLFKPFEQQNENRSGLGLGLSIAQKAITLNDGKIEVKNLPGKGCIFKIILPKKTT